MICNNCGKENENGVNVCVQCGSNLVVTPIAPSSTTKKSNSFVKLLLDGLNKLKTYLIKPLESIDDESTDIKKVGITGGILVVSMMIVNLIMTMIDSLRTVSISWTGKTSYTIEFSNLGDLNYLSLIFKNLFVYAIVMAAIAGIFYLGSLIVKKEINYFKLLSIVYISSIPFFIGNMVLPAIFNFISGQLSIIAIIIATVYSICIFASLINKEIKLEGTAKLYYNSACYSSIILIVYFIVVKLILSTVSSVGSIFGL